MRRTLVLLVGLAAEYAAACELRRHSIPFDGKAHQQIGFTDLECPDPVLGAYVLEQGPDNLLTFRRGAGQAAEEQTVQFFALRGRTPEALIEAIAKPLIAPEDKGKCVVKPGYSPGTWRYTPIDSYAEALEANGLWGACGPYGDGNETQQFWFTIDGVLLAYLSTGYAAPAFAIERVRYTNTKTPGVVE